MFPQTGEALRHPTAARRRPAPAALALFLLCALAAPALAQNNSFSSGSTGADGAFAPATGTTTVQVPESGVLNYTTVSIPGGATVIFVRNSRNTPVTILATGAVTIGGSINIDGQAGKTNGAGGLGGPGGFSGGTSGYGFDGFAGIAGDGPGGGAGGGSTNGTNIGGGGGGGFATAGGNATGTAAGAGGPRYSSTALLPLIGGSGGGGGGATVNSTAGAGGGGGGGLLIASSTTINFTGQILARGGASSQVSPSRGGSGGGGSGGSIRFVANTIVGAGTFHVTGGDGAAGFTGEFRGGSGAPGYIRIEAYDYGNFNPNSGGSVPISFALPNPAVVQNAPRLRVAAVGGVGAPANPLGSLHGAPDIVIPSTQTNPVEVSIEGANIPVGTVTQVTVAPATGARSTVPSTALVGTDTASTATAAVTLPSGISVISATAIIDLTTASAAPVFIEGERVDRIEVAASFGGASELTYVTRSGRRVKRVSE